MLDWRAVTFNFGCGRSHGHERVLAAWQWAELVRAAGWEIVFAQEVPDEAWLDEWEHDYEVFIGEGCQYRARSALMIRHPIVSKPLDVPTQGYHGSYVAAATAMLPGIGEVALMSVHASANVVGDTWRELWSGTEMPIPEPRPGRDLVDADLLLTTVQLVAREHRVLAAGDWNEARAWDDTFPGDSGKEFFDRVRRDGLVDCTSTMWWEERPTSRPHRGAGLQIDHIFASPRVSLVVVDAEVLGTGPLAGGSDHLPISFTLRFDDLGD